MLTPRPLNFLMASLHVKDSSEYLKPRLHPLFLFRPVLEFTTMDPDPFDEIFGLEESYYAEGFKLGEEDGKKDGLVHGRSLGKTNGFEIFLDMGRLHGRSVIWNSRLPLTTTYQDEPTQAKDEEKHLPFMPNLKSRSSQNVEEAGDDQPIPLRPLAENARLEKHIRMLYSLTEPESLSLQNKEEDVSDFVDRYKRAESKAMIIGKLLSEEARVTRSKALDSLIDSQQTQTRSEAGIEDANILHARH